MKYYIDNEVDITLDFDYAALYERVVNTCLDYFTCPYECEVSLLLTDNDGIQQINRDTRSIDSATDVLSFPNVSFVSAGDFSDINDDFLFEPDSGELMLGDIVLSVERVISQAEEYQHDVVREYAFLIVHSMLHLLGFDHIEDNDRTIMEQKQREIMSILNILR